MRKWNNQPPPKQPVRPARPRPRSLTRLCSLQLRGLDHVRDVPTQKDAPIVKHAICRSFSFLVTDFLLKCYVLQKESKTRYLATLRFQYAPPTPGCKKLANPPPRNITIIFWLKLVYGIPHISVWSLSGQQRNKKAVWGHLPLNSDLIFFLGIYDI